MIADLVEQGQAQGTIRKNIDPELAASELLMFAWAEDIARLTGLDQLVDNGTFLKVLDLFIRDLAAPTSERPVTT